jgi:SAM-dependent methyltransferase
MNTWLPEFCCPDCRTRVVEHGEEILVCDGCGQSYRLQSDIWDFLPERERARFDGFWRQYRTIRENEGRRSVTPDFYRRLPSVSRTDPFASEWRVRGESYRHLLRHVLATGPQPGTILDLGAGSGWLAHRLSLLGHRVVAVDVLADDLDALGVVRHFATPIVAVRADFDALPFLDGQFDVVVFNGSLHYAPDAAASLTKARRMLRRGGALVVMDSPMFTADRDGAAMLGEWTLRMASEHHLKSVVQPGCGFLTFGCLDAAAGAMNLEHQFVRSRGPLAWRVRRRFARIRLGRQPASFGVWMAR